MAGLLAAEPARVSGVVPPPPAAHEGVKAVGTSATRLDWDRPLIATPFDCPHCGLTLVQHRHPDGGGTIYFHADTARWGLPGFTRWDWRRFSLVVPDRAILHRRRPGGHGIPPIVALWGDLMDWCDALHAVLDEADFWQRLADAQTRQLGGVTFGFVNPVTAAVPPHAEYSAYNRPVLPGGEISGIARGFTDIAIDHPPTDRYRAGHADGPAVPE